MRSETVYASVGTVTGPADGRAGGLGVELPAARSAILVAARLLKPLGNPAQNGIKFFATSELLELVKDRAWLVKMTNAVNQHWQKKNATKRELRLPTAV